jgi:hypothetical protein
MHFMSSRKILYFLFLTTFAFGCKDDEIEFPAEPKIEMVSATPTNPLQYSEPVTITIKYEDGDGDLGENNDQVKNCFVTDNRIGLTSEYRIKQLAPTGYSIPITGTLNIEIGGQGITDGSSSQNVTYTMYLVDRAGHKSNVITTPVITIRK